jgi:RNA polymerase sigma-70 factor, ECF subfamily
MMERTAMRQHESHEDASDVKNVGDAVLVERFRDGDERAFDAIVLRYQARLIRMARGILGDEHAAMDAAQDAFVQAYRNLRKFRGESGLYTWLYRILYNRCISMKRHDSVIPFVSADDENVPDIPSGDADPGEICERRGFRAAVEAAVKNLPERQGMVFRLRQFEGLAHREIGDMLGITEGAVKATYFHAVKKLQQELEPWNRN